VVTGSPPVVDLDAPLAVVDPPVPAPDLVVAGHVLHRAARRRVEVVRFEVHGERRRPGQVGSEWAGNRIDRQADRPERLRDDDAHVAHGHRVTIVVQRACEPGVVLARPGLHRDVAVAAAGVLVAADAGDQRCRTGRVDGAEPVPVEEPHVGGRRMAHRERGLVEQCLVEVAQVRVPEVHRLPLPRCL